MLPVMSSISMPEASTPAVSHTCEPCPTSRGRRFLKSHGYGYHSRSIWFRSRDLHRTTDRLSEVTRIGFVEQLFSGVFRLQQFSTPPHQDGGMEPAPAASLRHPHPRSWVLPLLPPRRVEHGSRLPSMKGTPAEVGLSPSLANSIAVGGFSLHMDNVNPGRLPGSAYPASLIHIVP